MPESGKYKKIPRPESFSFFEKRVKNYPFCKNITRSDEQVYKIIRQGKSDLVVFLTNIYIVGEADVYEIMDEYPEVNTIVTVSAWNSYSWSAKELAKEYGIALFKMNEFQGAIYYDGDRYIDYETPKRDREDFDRK